MKKDDCKLFSRNKKRNTFGVQHISLKILFQNAFRNVAEVFNINTIYMEFGMEVLNNYI